MNYDIADIDGFLFDFDGVLTNNKVIVDENGKESVICSRADGLAFDVLKKFNKIIRVFSTETNSVVINRAKKLGIEATNSIKSKKHTLARLAQEYSWDLSKFVYVGNDLNDYEVMLMCGTTYCPSDAHKDIINISSYVLKSRGGEGVVREIVEEILNIKPLDYLKD